MFRPGDQTMSSSSGSTGARNPDSLTESKSQGDQNCLVIGEVPKRQKRPTVLISEEDTGKSVTTKSSGRSDDAAAYTTKVKKVSKTNLFSEAKARSLHSKEGTTSEEYAPDDMEYISSEQDEVQAHSQASQRSTDRSKSFSQIYSEIFEESIERQQKAERACQAYNVSRSKLHGTHKRSDSRGRESETFSSLESNYSSDLGNRSKQYDRHSIDEFDCTAISEGQLTHSVGYRKITPFNTIRSSCKIPSSKHSERSECSDKKLEYRKPDTKKYYEDKEYYDEYSANTYLPRSSLSLLESSVCIESSVYSKPRKYHRESSNTKETNGRDYLTDWRSVSGTGNPTSVASSSRTQRDYQPRDSTRHSHHHYCRLESVPKTYQDRGNSPINIKTRRQTVESRNPYSDMDTEEERDGSFRRSNVSVGVQYPSDDEEQDSGEEFSDISFPRPGRKSYSEENDVLSFTQLVRNVYDQDREMTDRSGSRIIGVTSVKEGPSQPSQYMFDDELTDPAGANTGKEFTDVCSEGTTNHLDEERYDKKDEFAYDCDRNVNPSEGTNELDQVDGETVEELTEDPTPSSEEEPSSTHQGPNEVSDQSNPTMDNPKTKTKNGLSLRIYNADEALMEIPEGFQGSAIILDDDADFLDITLTDDEEHIRAKLMAAALTTRTSNPSSSVNTSRKSRRSTDSTSSISSYKPSVIFSRRSEVVENNAPRTDRVSLLAEQVLRACANPYAEPSNWESLATPNTDWQPMEESDCSKLASSILDDRDNTLNGALQLLTQDFNRKLQRQLKEIAKSFH